MIDKRGWKMEYIDIDKTMCELISCKKPEIKNKKGLIFGELLEAYAGFGVEISPKYISNLLVCEVGTSKKKASDIVSHFLGKYGLKTGRVENRYSKRMVEHKPTLIITPHLDKNERIVIDTQTITHALACMEIRHTKEEIPIF